MKKFLAIISALALVIGCLSVMAAAAELPAPLTGEYKLIKKEVTLWHGRAALFRIWKSLFRAPI